MITETSGEGNLIGGPDQFLAFSTFPSAAARLRDVSRPEKNEKGRANRHTTFFNNIGVSGPKGGMKTMGMKKRFMELMWRMQQSQTLIGLIIWSLTLTGIFYPYLRDKFGIDPSNVLLPMMGLFLLIFGTVICIGLLFDKLRFWKEQNIVLAERNPYAYYKFTARELQIMTLFMMALRELPARSEELVEERRFFELWLKKVVDDDPRIAREVQEVREWVLKGKPMNEPSMR